MSNVRRYRIESEDGTVSYLHADPRSESYAPRHYEPPMDIDRRKVRIYLCLALLIWSVASTLDYWGF